MSDATRARWAQAGALTTAGTVAATILCCLPFATGIVGATLAAVGARFEPIRPYLIAISVGLLGYAFYAAYTRASTCAGESCDAPTTGRAPRVVVWLVAAIVVLLLTASWWANWVIYWTL
ncbi:MAG: mercuric transporter MerT family protein [Vicinamibacterales bacterium]